MLEIFWYELISVLSGTSHGSFLTGHCLPDVGFLHIAWLTAMTDSGMEVLPDAGHSMC